MGGMNFGQGGGPLGPMPAPQSAPHISSLAGGVPGPMASTPQGGSGARSQGFQPWGGQQQSGSMYGPPPWYTAFQNFLSGQRPPSMGAASQFNPTMMQQNAPAQSLGNLTAMPDPSQGRRQL